MVLCGGACAAGGAACAARGMARARLSGIRAEAKSGFMASTPENRPFSLPVRTLSVHPGRATDQDDMISFIRGSDLTKCYFRPR